MSIDLEKLTFQYFTNKNGYNKYLENIDKKDEYTDYFENIKLNKLKVKEELSNIIDNICLNEIDYQSLNALKKLYERDKILNKEKTELLNDLEIIENDKRIFKKKDDFWKKN